MIAYEAPRLTVAIPLHGSARWIEGIMANVSKAPAFSRVVISDASGLDDACDRLGSYLAGNPLVSVIRRPERLDWISHCNLLLGESETEFFCWLPHDDVILSDDYFERLVGLLERDTSAVVAFPGVHAVYGVGRIARRPEFIARLADSGDGTPVRFCLEEPGLLFASNWRGIPWKGVFRTAQSRPMPPIEDGTASDVAWTFSMLLAGDLVEVPDALYLKRWHRRSATYLLGPTSTGPLENAIRNEIDARYPGFDHRKETIAAELRRLVQSSRESHSRESRLIRKLVRRLLNEPRPYFE